MDFLALYQWMFSSFVPNGEENLIQDLKKQGYTHAVLMKRSWYFGLFLTPYLLIIALVVIINVYVIFRSFPHINYAYIITFLVVLSAAFSILSSIVYLWVFYKTHKYDNNFKEITDLLLEVERGDRAFARFFNSVTWNYFLLIFILIIVFGYWGFLYLFIPGSFSLGFFLFSSLSVGCFVAQIFLLSRYRRRIIDLEMDFTLIVRGRLYMQNQEDMLSKSQVIEGEKVRSVSISYPGLVASFLRYGNLEILTEGHGAGISLEYIYKPDEAVTVINNVLKSSHVKREIKNIFLIHICEVEHLPNLESDENKKKVTEYLHTHDADIQKLFLEGTKEDKQDIEEVYKMFYSL